MEEWRTHKVTVKAIAGGVTHGKDEWVVTIEFKVVGLVDDLVE